MKRITVSRGATTTRVPVGIDPNTNEGRSEGFWNGSYECFLAAEKLDDEMQDTVGEYILIFHALELGLKAFLAKHGYSNRDLRQEPFGHNLVNLCATACKHGLSIQAYESDGLIKWLSESYNSLRYDFTEEREHPMGQVLFPVVDAVLVASQPTRADKTPSR